MCGEINVKDFGAVGDGSNDDTSAINNAIASAIPMAGSVSTRRGATVCLPPGQYKITDTIRVADVAGMVIRGSGTLASSLVWAGTANKPALRLTNVRDSSFEHFSIGATPLAPLQTGVLIEHEVPRTEIPTNCQFRDLLIDGTGPNLPAYPQPGLENGFQIGGVGLDENNDFHSFYACKVTNFSGSGWVLGGNNAKSIRFYSCAFNSNSFDYGNYGVRCDKGSFEWYGGGGGFSNEADFYVGAPVDKILVSGANFEDSRRLLVTGANLVAPLSVILDSVRWTSNRPTFQPGDPCIEFNFSGPLVIRGGHLGTGPNWTRIVVSAGTRYGFECTGVDFSASGSVDHNPFDLPNNPHSNIRIGANVFRDALGQAQVAGSITGTAPNVFTSDVFLADNATPTTVSSFTGTWPNKRITVVGDGKTSLTNTASIVLKTTGPRLLLDGDVVELIFAKGMWREM